MTAYRFRVKFAPDPMPLWQDIVVGVDRPIAEFQSAINPAVGLDQSHLWFIGNDAEYWDSEVKYQCPQEYEQSSGGPALRTERLENASEVTLGGMAQQFDLEQYDGFVTSTTTVTSGASTLC
jgi:hypothetical protein